MMCIVLLSVCMIHLSFIDTRLYIVQLKLILQFDWSVPPSPLPLSQMESIFALDSVQNTIIVGMKYRGAKVVLCCFLFHIYLLRTCFLAHIIIQADLHSPPGTVIIPRGLL